jgi:hypothetical protein
MPFVLAIWWHRIAVLNRTFKTTGYPLIQCDQSDLDGRVGGYGDFRRVYLKGSAVTLHAEPTYGSLTFKGWSHANHPLITSADLPLKITDNVAYTAVYQ